MGDIASPSVSASVIENADEQLRDRLQTELREAKLASLATGYTAGLIAGIREATTIANWLDGDAKARAKSQILHQWESLQALADKPTFEQHANAFLLDRRVLRNLLCTGVLRASSMPFTVAPTPLSKDLLCGTCGRKYIGSELHVGSACVHCPGRLGLLVPLEPEVLDSMEPLKRGHADIQVLKRPDRQPLWSDDPDCLKCGKKNAYHYAKHGYFQCSCGHNWFDSREAYEAGQARGREAKA